MSKQPHKDLKTYLRDHYAGGVGALELLEHWTAKCQNGPLEIFFRSLQKEVQEDHDTLRQIMATWEISESTLRDLSAWIGEKFGRAKLGFGADTGGIVLVQALEALYVGITGKRLLWRGLAASRIDPVPERTNFKVLEERALKQLELVEEMRLRTVIKTFHDAALEL